MEFRSLLQTVNSEIFARDLFSRNFADAKFRENKPSRNGDIILSVNDVGKSCPNLVANCNVTIMTFNAYRENKFLSKISEFTILANISHAVISGDGRRLQRCLDLHLYPYFVYGSSEGSGESAHMRKLIFAVAVSHAKSSEIMRTVL